MDALAVEVLPGRPGYDLRPRYDDGSQLLVLESDRPAHWPYGTTVDGLLTLDLDEERTWVHGELIAPQDRWTRAPVVLPDRRLPDAVLRLPNLSTDTLGMGPRVSLATDGNVLLVQFGAVDHAALRPIGTAVDALCAHDRLVGLAIDLVGVSS